MPGRGHVDPGDLPDDRCRRNTIDKLLADLGEACAEYQDGA